MTTKERRDFARGLVNIPIGFIVRGRYYDGLIKDISKDGVFIETSGTVSVGQQISLYFRKETLDGTIVWINPQGLGVKFRKP